jgi:hypothetical protein
MSNEEKLKQLLKIATENGWSTKIDWISEKSKLSYYTQQGGHYTLYSGNGKSYDFRLNDLIINYEEGEVSFIEALCKATKSVLSYSNHQYWLSNIITNINFDFTHEELVFLWNFEVELRNDGNHRINPRPTSQRLNWLFETFNHLLNND